MIPWACSALLQLTIYSCIYNKNRLLPSFQTSESLVQLTPCIPESATLVCGLSDSSTMRSQPWQPPLRSYAWCGSVRNHFRLPRPPDPAGLCAAHSFHSQARRTCARPVRLDTNALAIALALYTTPRAPWRPTRPLALFTPPQILCALDVFPSDQGRFRYCSP